MQLNQIQELIIEEMYLFLKTGVAIIWQKFIFRFSFLKL